MQVTASILNSAGFVFDGGNFVPAVNTAPGIWETVWNGAADGAHTIDFIASNEGGTTMQTARVRMDNTAPTLSILSPTSNAVAFSIQNLQAQASDGVNRFGTVRFQLDGQEVAFL